SSRTSTSARRRQATPFSSRAMGSRGWWTTAGCSSSSDLAPPRSESWMRSLRKRTGGVGSTTSLPSSSGSSALTRCRAPRTRSRRSVLLSLPAPSAVADMPEDTVGSLAELYLGNILYAIELAAHTLDEQGRPDDAAFYRGIARKLAEARGREKEK